MHAWVQYTDAYTCCILRTIHLVHDGADKNWLDMGAQITAIGQYYKFNNCLFTYHEVSSQFKAHLSGLRVHELLFI